MPQEHEPDQPSRPTEIPDLEQLEVEKLPDAAAQLLKKAMADLIELDAIRMEMANADPSLGADELNALCRELASKRIMLRETMERLGVETNLKQKREDI